MCGLCLVRPEFIPVVEVEFFTRLDISKCKDADPFEFGDGACVRPVVGSKTYVRFLPCSLTIVDIPAFEVVLLLSIEVQVVVDLDPVMACAGLIFNLIDCFSAIPGYKLTFHCVF